MLPKLKFSDYSPVALFTTWELYLENIPSRLFFSLPKTSQTSNNTTRRKQKNISDIITCLLKRTVFSIGCCSYIQYEVHWSDTTPTSKEMLLQPTQNSIKNINAFFTRLYNIMTIFGSARCKKLLRYLIRRYHDGATGCNFYNPCS